MITGDEPQLGGQETDISPMISGRGTRIIVSARGAYVAGSLRRLIELMDDHQQLAFRQALVQQTFNAIRAEIDEAIQKGQSQLVEFVPAIENWLADPSEENAQQVHDLDLSTPSNRADSRVVIPNWCPLPVGQPIEASPINNEVWFARRLQTGLIRAVLDFPGWPAEPILNTLPLSAICPTDAHWDGLWSEVHVWLLDAAWAILQGAAIPPLDTSRAGIERRLGDAELWYRRKHLELMVNLMTPTQQQRFRQAVLEQALQCINTVPLDRWSPAERQVIEMARRWIVAPGLVETEIQQAPRIKFMPTDRFTKPGLMAAHALIKAFGREPDRERESGLSNLNVWYAHYAADIAGHVKQLSDGLPAAAFVESQAAMRAWQIEAAWAVLHDEPISPYEFGAANTSG